MSSSFSDRLAVLPQYLIPQQALTALAGRLAGWQGGRWTTAAIDRSVARYGVDMSEAENPDTSSYASFNAFFTRPLRSGARPLAKADFVCPVDGALSQCGPIQDQLRELVAGKIDAARHQITELMTFAAELQQAASALERHRPDGECDADCGCITDPTATLPTTGPDCFDCFDWFATSQCHRSAVRSHSDELCFAQWCAGIIAPVVGFDGDYSPANENGASNRQALWL